MSVTSDVHVGDVGTRYHVKIQDAGVAFDPTSATVKTLIFKTPAGVLEREATVVHVGSDWYLDYTTLDGIDDDFHARKGTYRLQGYVEFADGQRYSTNIETYVVERNLW